MATPRKDAVALLTPVRRGQRASGASRAQTTPKRSRS